MSHQSSLIATDIDEYLAQHERKELLRFITCGSVDDGKSTLIGRLLYEAKGIFDDQVASLKRESITYGTQGGEGIVAGRPQELGSKIDAAGRSRSSMAPIVSVIFLLFRFLFPGI